MLRGLRLWIPGLLLCLVGAYRIAFPSAEAATSRLAALPMTLLGLTGEDVPVGQAILDDLHPEELLIRRYQRPDDIPVWVVLIFFSNRRLGGHDPQLCYRSQGYQVQALPEVELGGAAQKGGAESFLAVRTGRAERVLTFWYTGGQQAYADVNRYRNQLFLQGLRQNSFYGVFVRVSTVDADRPAEAEVWNRRFAEEVVRHLPGLVGP